MRFLGIFAALAFALDQLSKYWVVVVMDLQTIRAIDVVPPLLNFRMGWNDGINFGLLSGANARWFLILIAFAICGLVLYWVRRETDRRTLASAGLLIGGAMGNLLDRILWGRVADFLNMSCCGIQNPFTFNVADVAIFTGAIGLVIWSGRTST